MKKLILVLFIVIVSFFAYPTYAKGDDYDVVTLSKCVDGNSARFMLGTSEIKVKFIGIDSVETIQDTLDDEIDGQDVSDYVCSVLTDADEIKIEYEPNSEKEDKYGRILAWVYVDDVLLQKNLVELGYSKVAFLYDNYKYTDILEEAELTAKEAKVGIWFEEEIKVSDDVLEEVVEVEVKEENDFFSSLLGFINEIFEKLLKFIDDLITDML